MSRSRSSFSRMEMRWRSCHVSTSLAADDCVLCIDVIGILSVFTINVFSGWLVVRFPMGARLSSDGNASLEETAVHPRSRLYATASEVGTLTAMVLNNIFVHSLLNSSSSSLICESMFFNVSFFNFVKSINEVSIIQFSPLLLTTIFLQCISTASAQTPRSFLR